MLVTGVWLGWWLDYPLLLRIIYIYIMRNTQFQEWLHDAAQLLASLSEKGWHLYCQWRMAGRYDPKVEPRWRLKSWRCRSGFSDLKRLGFLFTIHIFQAAISAECFLEIQSRGFLWHGMSWFIAFVRKFVASIWVASGIRCGIAGMGWVSMGPRLVFGHGFLKKGMVYSLAI